MHKFEKGIFIGKFYPLHIGHLSTLQILAEKSQEAFLIFYHDEQVEERLAAQLGSAYTIQQRVNDAQEIVKEFGNVTVRVLSVPPEITFPRDFLKIKKMIDELIEGEADVQIFGADEETTYLPYKYTGSYLLGPPYEVEDEAGNIVSLHASAIRNNYSYFKKYLPTRVLKTLSKSQ